MITRDEILARSASGGGFPLLTLDEFFTGNAQEWSIAPNQEPLGRPPLAEIARRLGTLEADAAVAWVRVQLHEEIFDDHAEDVDAEAVLICTSLQDDVIDARLDVEELQAEPVSGGLSYDEDQYYDMPPMPAGHRVVTLMWD